MYYYVQLHCTYGGTDGGQHFVFCLVTLDVQLQSSRGSAVLPPSSAGGKFGPRLLPLQAALFRIMRVI